MNAAPLGIIAGGGALPEMIARAAIKQGREVTVLALTGEADGSLDPFAPHWINMGELRRGISLLQKGGVRDLVIVGKVRRPGLRNFRGDSEGWKFLLHWVITKRSSDEQLLQALQRYLKERGGFRIIAAQEICESLLTAPGFLGHHCANNETQKDITLGIKVARASAKYDIGQGVVVCRGVVLAVEAQEQTNNMLRRVSELGESLRGSSQERAGVFVKLPKPLQTRELDWPVIGEKTIIEASRAGLSGIVLQAGGCLLVDAEAIARRIDAEEMFLLSLEADEIAERTSHDQDDR
ncbi:MAG: UDP-2,3-diacylglucosamine diphosphatase LpxI [Hyphomicrobiales bacterium]|nr:UDP-2,3-diacylglucosamine diphosphatase LpxI [Hyphomicrobiales bacterium]